MGIEFSVQFDEPPWYTESAANRKRVVDLVRALPSVVQGHAEPPEIWLKDPSSTSSWDFDVRLFLRDDSIFVEVSASTPAFSRDVRHLVDWIVRQTPAWLVDDDRERVVW